MSPEAVTEKGGETRRRILETARVAFTQNGYRSTSMNDLIAAAGVTKGGFYFHFPSKADVGIEVVRSEQARLRGEVLAVAAEHERACDQIVAMVRALLPAIETLKTTMGLERLCADLRTDGVDDPAVMRPHAPWIGATAELFARAQAEGDMRPDIDPQVAALFAVGAFCGLETLAAGDPAVDSRLGMPADEYLRFVGAAVGLSVPALD
jgi:AcrR family transcriptional regulator